MTTKGQKKSMAKVMYIDNGELKVILFESMSRAQGYAELMNKVHGRIVYSASNRMFDVTIED